VRQDESGSVLVLAVGLVVVALLVIAVVTDSAALFLARRSLAATADGAALAGAQGADLARVYAGEAGRSLPLSSAAARSRVRAYLRASGSAPGGEPVSLRLFRCDGRTVTVRLAEVVRPPFVSWFGGAGRVTVVAEAAASSPVG
jgi:hypothetical protein